MRDMTTELLLDRLDRRAVEVAKLQRRLGRSQYWRKQAEAKLSAAEAALAEQLEARNRSEEVCGKSADLLRDYQREVGDLRTTRMQLEDKLAAAERALAEAKPSGQMATETFEGGGLAERDLDIVNRSLEAKLADLRAQAVERQEQLDSAVAQRNGCRLARRRLEEELADAQRRAAEAEGALEAARRERDEWESAHDGWRRRAEASEGERNAALEEVERWKIEANNRMDKWLTEVAGPEGGAVWAAHPARRLAGGRPAVRRQRRPLAQAP